MWNEHFLPNFTKPPIEEYEFGIVKVYNLRRNSVQNIWSKNVIPDFTKIASIEEYEFGTVKVYKKKQCRDYVKLLFWFYKSAN